ncbi:unnamed protein product [Peronospora belbahrii]|uniref:Uncharacterized protein n=1 Tax=Peronospora belbahrii TaxID=622444 RepID=A0ABN8DA86_9STRA|nr:unnamed protein product [Peronospora belbahrii]
MLPFKTLLGTQEMANGLEYFTPTMLSVDDASKDYLWEMRGIEMSEIEKEKETGTSISLSASAFEADVKAQFYRQLSLKTFKNVFEPSHGTWIGLAVPEAPGNVSMSFETESISELNFNHSYISGLLDFFKIKLQSSPHVKEKCRIETDKSEDLAISMTVSASFAFSWNRTNDPREVAISENPLAWRSLESQQLTETNNQSPRIRNKLFGENHPIPLLGSSTSPLDKMDLTSAGHSCVKA